MREAIRRSNHWIGLLFLVGLIAAGLAACGSSSDTSATTNGGSSGSGGVSAEAKTTFEKFSKPITSFVGGPSEPVKPPPGKNLTIITCGSQGITCVRVANGAKAAAETLGYKAKIVDGQSNPSVWNEAILNALSSGSDGIILAAVSPPLVTGALEAAEKAGVPVAATLDTAGEDLAVRVNYDRSDVATANAAFVAEDSGGEAEVLLLTDVSEFPDLKIDRELWPKQLEADCEGNCKVAETIEFNVVQAAQRLAGDIAQTLRSHPDVKYISLPFDTIAPFVEQGIRQAGKTGQVKMVGNGGDPPSIEAIEAEEMVVSLGTPAEWMGWDAVDGLLRVMTGEKVPPLEKAGETNYKVPVRYITAEDEVGPEGWQGDFDYEAAFEKLWGK
jgi:ribose transport system substrate-binding protein